jgi:DNA-directed RNA polymerase specialized sigma24 family protein
LRKDVAINNRFEPNSQAVERKPMEELVKYLRALVLLQVQAMSGDEAPVKVEITLSRAGFSAREIAEMTGKTQAAVAKAISRARAKKGTDTDE